jgi:hypothetical protein
VNRFLHAVFLSAVLINAGLCVDIQPGPEAAKLPVSVEIVVPAATKPDDQQV